jgi:hypothetical protein
MKQIKFFLWVAIIMPFMINCSSEEVKIQDPTPIETIPAVEIEKEESREEIFKGTIVEVKDKIVIISFQDQMGLKKGVNVNYREVGSNKIISTGKVTELRNMSAKATFIDVVPTKGLEVVAYGKWSKYYNITNWGSASAICTGLGMRLPSKNELLSAYKTGVTKLWEKDATWFWTSEEATMNGVYCLGISKGKFSPHHRDLNYACAVRCISDLD